MLPEITVQLEWDEDQECWVTTVPELLGISTFGKTQEQALESTREMVLGYVESMRSNGLRLPLPAAAVRRLISALS
jgi:predicted RNase H-like HicB family nuclease